MMELTAAEVQKISDRLLVLREKLRENGATVFAPTPEWSALHREVAVLKRKLNADAAMKRAAARAAARIAQLQSGPKPQFTRSAFPAGLTPASTQR
jgi:hypothetical protein